MYRWRCWRRRCCQTVCKKELLLFRYWKCQKTTSVVAYNDLLKRDTSHIIWHIEVIEVNNISISIDPLPLATISCPPVVLIAWFEASRSLCSWFDSGAARMGHLQHSILSQTTCSTTRSGSHPKSEKVFRCTFLGKEMSVWPESWKDECLSVPRIRHAIYMIISFHVHYSTCWFLWAAHNPHDFKSHNFQSTTSRSLWMASQKLVAVELEGGTLDDHYGTLDG